MAGTLLGGLVATIAPSVGFADAASASASSCNATKVARDDLPSVVTISVVNGKTGDTGSGEVIRAGGYILTNNHVVAAAATGGSITVLFSDGDTAPAAIVGRDPQTDLAVIKVSSSTPKPIPLGSSANVEVGQPVVALGAPLGLSSTVTAGIVSALDRTVEVPGEADSSALLVDAIQTDAAINPGNSGGSLVNCSGRLIGIPSAGASVPGASGQSSVGNIGLGFAIPVDLAKTISSEIISTGRVVHAYLGVEAVPLPEAQPQASSSEGLYVVQVQPRGPVAQAGIGVGDILTTIDGKKVAGSEQLATITLTRKPGTKVEIGYQRHGRSATATVVLGTQP